MTRTIVCSLAAMLVAAAVVAQQPVSAPQQAQSQAAAQKAPEGPRPVIDIAEKIKDFGTVAKGEKIRAILGGRNPGKPPLEVPQVRPPGGCTVASFDRTIPPGGTGKITAELDTTGFSGPVSKAVLGFSNDPATPPGNRVSKGDG